MPHVDATTRFGPVIIITVIINTIITIIIVTIIIAHRW